MSYCRIIFVAILGALLSAGIAEARALVGYFPSWDARYSLTQSPDGFSHVVVAFARPAFSFDGKSFKGTGLQFETTPDAVKKDIAALQAKGVRVLLAVGGATYKVWAPLAAEGDRPGPITTALARFIGEMGFDGIDVDYEDPGTSPAKIAQYRAVIFALRRAAGNGMLSLAAWASGADCTTATGTEVCNGKLSYLDNGAGRERLLFRNPDVANKIDMISVMSYDSGLASFDPVRAFTLYRALIPSRIALNIGFEIAPEDWGGAILVGEDSDAQCTAAKVRADQFGTAVNKPYSVARGLREGPLAAGDKDGAMLWHMFKTGPLPHCGGRTAVSPTDVTRIVHRLMQR